MRLYANRFTKNRKRFDWWDTRISSTSLFLHPSIFSLIFFGFLNPSIHPSIHPSICFTTQTKPQVSSSHPNLIFSGKTMEKSPCLMGKPWKITWGLLYPALRPRLRGASARFGAAALPRRVPGAAPGPHLRGHRPDALQQEAPGGDDSLRQGGSVADTIRSWDEELFVFLKKCGGWIDAGFDGCLFELTDLESFYCMG